MEIITPQEFMEKIHQASKAINFDEVHQVVDLLQDAYINKRSVYVFGNGGSGATASHFCEDLGKGTIDDSNIEHRFRVMSLTDNTPYILAWANDHGYETIFEQQLKNFADPYDVAIAISGSGNSENVLRAIDFANSAGLKTVGVTGFDGGRLKEITHYNIHVPINDMGVVESIHIIIFHYIVYNLRDRIANLNGKLQRITQNISKFVK
ncbi:SIS domain-containing protein [bacterium]|nr:SIS domain-containing protein [bacterium]